MQYLSAGVQQSRDPFQGSTGTGRPEIRRQSQLKGVPPTTCRPCPTWPSTPAAPFPPSTAFNESQQDEEIAISELINGTAPAKAMTFAAQGQDTVFEQAGLKTAGRRASRPGLAPAGEGETRPPARPSAPPGTDQQREATMRRHPAWKARAPGPVC